MCDFVWKSSAPLSASHVSVGHAVLSLKVDTFNLWAPDSGNGNRRLILAAEMCGGGGAMFAVELNSPQWALTRGPMPQAIAASRSKEVADKIGNLVDLLNRDHGIVISIHTDYAAIFANFEFREAMQKRGVECVFSRYSMLHGRQIRDILDLIRDV